MNNNFLSTNSQRSDFINNKGFNANPTLTGYANDAFKAADTAGFNFSKDYNYDQNNFNLDDFNAGLAGAQQNAFGNYFTGREKNKGDSFADIDFSSFTGEGLFGNSPANTGTLFNRPDGGPKIDAGNKPVTRFATAEEIEQGLADSNGYITERVTYAPAPFEAQQMGLYETIGDAYDEMMMGGEATKEALDANINTAGSSAIAKLANLDQYNTDTQTEIDDYYNTRKGLLGDDMQAITDALRDNNAMAMQAGSRGSGMQGMMARASMLAAQQQQSAKDAVLTEEAQANKQLAENIIGLRKGIRDAQTVEEAQAKQQYTSAIEGLKTAFAEVIGSTPEETEWVISLAEEMVLTTAALGDARVQGVKDVVKGMESALRQFADDPTIWESMQSNLLTELDNLGIQDELIRSNLVDGVNSLDDIFGIVDSLLQYDPFLDLIQKNLVDADSLYNYLIGATGGNSPTGDSPAFSSQSSTTVDGLQSGGSPSTAPAAGTTGDIGTTLFNGLEQGSNFLNDDTSNNESTLVNTLR